MSPRTLLPIAAASVMLAVAPATAALASSSSARPATHSERASVISAFDANDGNSSEVRGVYVSRLSSSLAVVCVRTPEAGMRAYVFTRSGRSWRYATSGAVGRAGSSADRRLEQACG